MTDNIILMDFIPHGSFEFGEYLNKYTGTKFKLYAWDNAGLRRNKWCEIKRYLGYFIHSFNIFLKRKNYDKILSWQQFYGLIFAFYCDVFHVKKVNFLVVMTFIYKEKTGLIGLLYKKFISRIVKSKYIDYLIVFSKWEKYYYAKIFGVPEEKFRFILLGIENDVYNKVNIDNLFPMTNRFYLSVGRSNRDYKFLFNSLKDEKVGLVVLCDQMQEDTTDEYIKIYSNIAGEQYLSFLNACYGVIITLDDPHISSGQLVILRAMQHRKPIIITEADGIRDYVENNKNALIIPKTKTALIEAINQLSQDNSLYNTLVNNGLDCYNNQFSIEALAKRISEIMV